MEQTIQLLNGDCVEKMQSFDENSIGAIVCDPPYGLSFMGKTWDDLNQSNDQQAWHYNWLKEAFRILKPGGIIKAFGGTRTFHRLAAAMEQVGFVDVGLDTWIYGSGFPKSLNISKALNKKMGGADELVPIDEKLIKKYDGYGTALKPAWEPIVIGKKPIQ